MVYLRSPDKVREEDGYNPLPLDDGQYYACSTPEQQHTHPHPPAAHIMQLKSAISKLLRCAARKHVYEPMCQP